MGCILKITDSYYITIRGKKNVQILESNGLLLVDVWYALKMMSNFVSLGQFENKGVTIVRNSKGSTTLARAGKRIASIH